MRKFTLMILSLIVFYSIAFGFWLGFHQVFYLYNFLIIGSSCALGLGLWPVLPKRRRHLARKLCQALLGGYMFLGLGLGFVYVGFGMIQPENMQMEGFWFLLLAGVFAASVMHYAISKISGPFFFGRVWCGWGCWTAGVLDLLPWQRSPGRRPGWGLARYAMAGVSAGLVFLLVFAFHYTARATSGIVDLSGTHSLARVYQNLLDIPEFWWFVGGNVVYYAAGIGLAAALRDNRAFCKYLCPVTALLKVGARFSLLRIKARGACSGCGACDAACPMDVRISEYVRAGRRVTSTECILCMTCVTTCASNALGASFGFDIGRRERLRLHGERRSRVGAASGNCS